MSKTMARTRSAHLARGFAGVTAATVLGNGFAYALLLSAARILTASNYSALVSLVNVLLVGSVPAFALQAVVARRVATNDTHDLVRVSALLALGVGLLFALLAPLETAFLHLPSSAGPLLAAVAVPGIAMQGLCQGVWQGKQHFGALAVVTFAGLLGRFGMALAGLWLTRTATGTVGALTLGVSIAAAGCFLRLPSLERGLRPGEHHHPSRAELLAESRSLLGEATVAAHAYAVLLLLSVADVLLAGHLLDRQQAAVYAAGSVMTKAALWLPQSAANVLFASMTDHGRHRNLFLRGAAGMFGLGATLTVGSWIANRLAAAVVGGNRYPQLHQHIWLFAALGSCLALMQFAVVSGLAIRDGRAAWVAWVTIAAEIGGVYLHRGHLGVGSIIATVAGVNVVAAALALLLRARRADHDAVPPADQDAGSSPGHGPGANTGS